MENKNKITAIILCGGLGTRLHSITNDLIPKPMVNVSGRPFLEYLFDYLIYQGVTKAVLAISHHKDIIINHFGNKYHKLDISYSIEEQPLGTGGAIKQAIEQNVDNKSELTLVLNGDTFVEYQLDNMIEQQLQNNSDIIMTLKQLDNTDRYGRVTVNENGKIIAFEEKVAGKNGNINTGVYLIKKNLFNHIKSNNKFSFEIDFLEKNINNSNFYASYISGYFIDIGIPSDYHISNGYFSQNNHTYN